jgi:hypothetical protein
LIDAAKGGMFRAVLNGGRRMIVTPRLAAALAAFAVAAFFSSPAAAEYCESIAWEGARFPDGACERAHEATIRYSGRTATLRLLVESETLSPSLRARIPVLRRVVDEVAAGVGPALTRIGAVALPGTIHIVIVNDTHREGAHAETVRRSTEPEDCPLIVYSAAAMADGALARTLAHEMFHCAQYRTWPRQMAAEGSRWWNEGSAEWFEDLALPGRAADSDMFEALRVFRTRSGAFPLTENTYSNMVFFSWLGPERIAGYVAQLAAGAESQLEGALRALDEDEYQRFAQDYIDEKIATPSGYLLAGPEFGPSVPPVHTTTGREGADPPYAPSTLHPALTLARGEIIFAPGDYAPRGDYGGRFVVFSERDQEWRALSSPLRADCGRKRVKFAAMSHRNARLVMDPGARRGTNPPCICPIGDWTIAPEDLEEAFSPTPDHRLVSFGEAVMRFNRDGTADFSARRLLFLGPTRTTGAVSARVDIQRSYRAKLGWSVSGDEIVLTDIEPLRIVERQTHYTRAPYGSGARTMPARQSEITESSTTGRGRKFRCDGNILTITPPFNRLGPGREWVDTDRELRYPFYGVYRRP